MSEKSAIVNSSFQGTGWSFPPVFDSADYRLRLSSGESNINQSIDILLNTVQGSRTMLPDYGCNLSSFLFQRLDATLQGEIVQMVKVTLLTGEPRIVVNAVAVTQSVQQGSIDIAINYTVKSTNSRHNYVYPFSLNEATLLNLGG